MNGLKEEFMLQKTDSLECRLRENLISSLDPWKRKFCESPTFLFLLEKFKQFLESTPSNFKENQQELSHAKMIFDDLCASNPQDKASHESMNESRQKEERLKQKYLLDLERLKEASKFS